MNAMSSHTPSSRSSHAVLSHNLIANIAADVGVIAPVSHQHELRQMDTNEHITDLHREAMRSVRCALSSKISPHPSHLHLVFELSALTYSSCDHPVRGDLLSHHIELLRLIVASSPDLANHQHLQHLGLLCDKPSQVVNSLEALSSLWSSSIYAPPDIARRSAIALHQAACHLESRLLSRLYSEQPHLFASVLTVATSSMFPRGVGHIAVGSSPVPARHTHAITASGVSLSVSNAPLFKATFTFLRDGIAFAMDRPTYATLCALLVSDPALLGRSYPRASISYPHASRSSILRLAPNIALPLTARRFVDLQKLVASATNHPDLITWRDFRASMFGDI